MCLKGNSEFRDKDVSVSLPFVFKSSSSFILLLLSLFFLEIQDGCKGEIQKDIINIFLKSSNPVIGEGYVERGAVE